MTQFVYVCYEIGGRISGHVSIKLAFRNEREAIVWCSQKPSQPGAQRFYLQTELMGAWRR